VQSGVIPKNIKEKPTSDGSKAKVNGKVYKLPKSRIGKSGIGKPVEKSLS
jgi:hypothetical protein